MKKKLALCFLVFALLVTCASATGASKKIGNASAESGSGVTVTKDTDQTVKVTYTGDKNSQYVVMAVDPEIVGDSVPTKTDIANHQDGVVYMDQVTGDPGDGSVEFIVHPNLDKAEKGDEYYIYVSSNASNGAMKKVGSFDIDIIEEILRKLGNVDGIGDIDLNDAIYILKYLANKPGYDLTGQDDVANVDGIGGIDLNDAIYILKYLANKPGYTL